MQTGCPRRPRTRGEGGPSGALEKRGGGRLRARDGLRRCAARVLARTRTATCLPNPNTRLMPIPVSWAGLGRRRTGAEGRGGQHPGVGLDARDGRAQAAAVRRL